MPRVRATLSQHGSTTRKSPDVPAAATWSVRTVSPEREVVADGWREKSGRGRARSASAATSTGSATSIGPGAACSWSIGAIFVPWTYGLSLVSRCRSSTSCCLPQAEQRRRLLQAATPSTGMRFRTERQRRVRPPEARRAQVRQDVGRHPHPRIAGLISPLGGDFAFRRRLRLQAATYAFRRRLRASGGDFAFRRRRQRPLPTPPHATYLPS